MKTKSFNSPFQSQNTRIEEPSYETLATPSERLLRLRKINAKSSFQDKLNKIERKKTVFTSPAEALLSENLLNFQENEKQTRYFSYDHNLHIKHLELQNNFLTGDKFRYARHKMVQDYIKTRGVHQEEVLYAMQNVPRHLFVSEALHATAYEDRPLPINGNQTISQPSVVALMCQLLEARPSMRILEVGTGSGYQATILHAMGLNVYSVERLPELYHATKKLLHDQLHCYDIQLSLSDGTLGWQEYAPYDRIIVAAGGPIIPEALKGQLAEGGIMLIPIGQEHHKQRIVRVFKINGKYREEDCGATTFVDLVGVSGW